MISILRYLLPLLFLGSLTIAGRAQEESNRKAPDVVYVPMRYSPPRIVTPLVRVSINGGTPENFFLDTGMGAALVVTEDFAKRANLPRTGKKRRVNQRIDLSQVAVKSVALETTEGELTVTGLDRALVVRAPLGSNAPGYDVAGVIGNSLLGYIPAQLNFKEQVMTLYLSRARFAPPKVPALALSETTNGLYETVVTPIPDVSVRMVIDTGAFQGSLHQNTLQLLPQDRRESSPFGMVEGLYLLEEVQVPSFAIGGLQEAASFDVYPTGLMEAGAPQLLGMQVLQHLRMTLDIPSRKLYLEPNPEPRFRRPKTDSGATLMTHKREIRVRKVEPGSPAANIGLQHGDEILKVDVMDIEGEPLAGVQRLLDGVAGSEAWITFRRGKEQKTVHYPRTTAFKSSERRAPWFEGTIGRILQGKPFEVLSLRPNAPLFRAGVRAGEQVTKINGFKVANQPFEKLMELLRDKQVTLAVRSKRGDVRTVVVHAPKETNKRK